MAIMVFTERYDEKSKRLINGAVIESRGHGVVAITQWDTGATATCISQRIVDELKLKPISQQHIHTPSGEKETNVYVANIILNNEIRLRDCRLIGTEIGAQGIDMLIGMDIITLGDFAVSNFNNHTQFTFRIPSEEDFDFTQNDK